MVEGVKRSEDSTVHQKESLQSAAETGRLDMVEMLLLKGADPLIKDSLGRLAINVAESLPINCDSIRR